MPEATPRSMPAIFENMLDDMRGKLSLCFETQHVLIFFRTCWETRKRVCPIVRLQMIAHVETQHEIADDKDVLLLLREKMYIYICQMLLLLKEKIYTYI